MERLTVRLVLDRGQHKPGSLSEPDPKMFRLAPSAEYNSISVLDEFPFFAMVERYRL